MLQGEGRGGGLRLRSGRDLGYPQGSSSWVCRLYCSQVWNEALKQARVEASSDLWKAEHVYYPPTIREDASSSSAVRDAPEEVEVVGLGAALATTPSERLAKGSKPSNVAEMSEGQNLDAPQGTVGSTGDALVS